uniref:Carboxypeptidase n=2 Tax=Lotharella globosa TaxID=91324 RepID=A0A7S3ZDE4_9EUKA
MMKGLGLADGDQLAKIQEYSDNCTALIKQGEYAAAFRVWDEMLNGDLYPYPNYFKNITGISDYFNFLHDVAPADQDYFAPFVQRPEVRRAIHAGAETPFGTNATDCEMHLVADFHVSMAPRVEALLDAGIKVMIFVGQLDIIIGAQLVEAYIPKLQWKGQSDYQSASRSLWKVGSRTAGYVRRARNLVQVTVRNAGHILPYDQPEAAKVMITNFVEDKEF